MDLKLPEEQVLKLLDVSLVYEDEPVLSDINLEVGQGERWVVLGQNGAGKTSLFRIASASLRPSAGLATVLGETLGRTDMRQLRKRIGISSTSIADKLRRDLIVEEVVLTGRFGDLAPWWHEYSSQDVRRMSDLLAMAGVHHLGRRIFSSLSAGEKQQVLIARALMSDPLLLMLDEPTSGLDMGARERFLERLNILVGEHEKLSLLMITHHIEDVPPSSTHALLLKSGRVVSVGAIRDVLNDENLSEAFDFPLKVEKYAGRYRAVAREH